MLYWNRKIIYSTVNRKVDCTVISPGKTEDLGNCYDRTPVHVCSYDVPRGQSIRPSPTETT